MTPVTMDELPAPLRAIQKEVEEQQRPESNLDALRPVWQEYVSKAREVLQDLYVEEDGEVLYLGGLSPGCRACKEGTWDCIFTTMHCNLDCQFCYSPHAIPRDYAGSLLGSTPEQIAGNHARTTITGISFSGGEPFVDAERLFDWASWFTGHYPDKYYWVYTNGLLATEEKLRRLAKLGIDEIRFNLAATGYDHPSVLENLAAAARHIPNVTVEIPAIPEHATKLLSCLADWSARGVRYLNLHELMYEPGTNSAALPGPRLAIVTADGHCSEINPESRMLTLAVMQHIQDAALSLAVNDCSLQSKVRQLRGRRKSLAPLLKEPHEELVRGEVYESYCAYRDEERLTYFSPGSLSRMRELYPKHRFVRLARTAPLSIADRGKWILFEPLEHKEGAAAGGS